MDLIYIIYIILGLLPSLIWLTFYLKEDKHPEPKKMILKIFFWGAVITVPVFFVQIGLVNLLELTTLSPTIQSIIRWFFIIALSEELFKYLVVRVKIFNSPNFDEPVDIMLYMVVSALGFAAVENILYLSSITGQLSFDETVSRALIIILVRFVGATFLHTLCSAFIGYAIAVSFSTAKKRYLPFIIGMSGAVLLHGLYNYSLMLIGGNMKIIYPSIIIIILSSLIFPGFSRLQKMKGICRVE